MCEVAVSGKCAARVFRGGRVVCGARSPEEQESRCQFFKAARNGVSCRHLGYGSYRSCNNMLVREYLAVEGSEV